MFQKKLSFAITTEKSTTNVSTEIKRLFFGLKKSKFGNGKNKFEPMEKESVEDADKIRSQLVKIRGSFCKLINIDIIE